MLEQRLLQPFTHAKYLSEQNFRNYIAIIHYLYIQDSVYFAQPSLPLAILEGIKENDSIGYFEDYTITKLEGDLKQLEDWGNVESIPDYGKQTRIEDFNKRKLRYNLTQVTIDIERMLEKINSQINRVKNKLDRGIVNTLQELFSNLALYKDNFNLTIDERNELTLLWNQTFDQFEQLRNESADYLRVIHSRNIEEAMQNKEISAFRVKFTEYLTSFIITLQKNINLIEHLIIQIDKTNINEIITLLIEEQKNKPTLEDPLSDEEYRNIFFNQWNAMKKWFIYDDFSERYVDYLLKQTNETISRFTKYLQQISERDQQIRNRKKDFEHIAKLFRNEDNFKLCQMSFGALTNIEKPLHFFSTKNRIIDNTLSIFEHEPEVMSLKEAKHVSSRNRKKAASLEPTEEDLLEIKRLNEIKEYEERQLSLLVNKEIVRLKDLENVEPFMRGALLQWINQTDGKKKLVGKTDQGVEFIIEKNSDDWICLQCTDGILQMPDYIFYFEVEKK